MNSLHSVIKVYSCGIVTATHLPSLSMMLTVTGPPTNEAGAATLPVRVKFSVPSTRRSSRMSIKMTSPSLVPSANVSSVWKKMKSRPTASERKLAGSVQDVVYWTYVSVVQQVKDTIDLHVALPPGCIEMMTIVSAGRTEVDVLMLSTTGTITSSVDWECAASFPTVACPNINWIAVGKEKSKNGVIDELRNFIQNSLTNISGKSCYFYFYFFLILFLYERFSILAGTHNIAVQ